MKKIKSNMKVYKTIASGFGIGNFPYAPGTMGSILGVILFYALNNLLNRFFVNPGVILSFNLFAIVIILFVGVYSIKKVHNIWKHDSSKIIIDEVVGVCIALLAVPFDWRYYLAGFILFRFFDILKPLGIKKIDNLNSNWSVMLDDVLAGIYSLIVLQVFYHLIVL